MTVASLTSLTPQDLAIQKRDWAFGRETPNPRWWLDNDAGRTAFYDALSSTFPLGERFFMDSVKRYRDNVPEALKQQISAFLFQEAMHSREHVVFNQQAEGNGYDMAPLEARTKKVIDWGRTQLPLFQLIATCALEHFTATLAHEALANADHFEKATPEAKRMWRWHAMEEIEHKAVAYDTFLHVTRNWSPLGRWALRSLIMFAATVRFHWIIGLNVRDLLKQDGKNDFATWMQLLGYLYGKKDGKRGMMRALVRGMFGYFKPGFHPWEDDDRALLRETEAWLKQATPLAA